jgi:hypothetical protein
MVALGIGVMVTELVVENVAQPPLAAVVYVTVYVPGVLVEGVMAPVLMLMESPAGVAAYVPPVVPV